MVLPVGGEQQAENWEVFWQALHTACTQAGLTFNPPVSETWEGSDDGHPVSYHFEHLKALGFKNTLIYWQYLGEALLGAQKDSKHAG